MKATADPPPFNSCAVAAPAASSRSRKLTRAPSRASFSTIARPMPCAPPVTRATLPARRPLIRAYDTTYAQAPRGDERSEALGPLAGQRFDLLGGAVDEAAHGRGGAARIVGANGLED